MLSERAEAVAALEKKIQDIQQEFDAKIEEKLAEQAEKVRRLQRFKDE